MLRERVARREHVAVELDAALGHAGGAAGEGDDARIVAAGVGGRQRLQRGGARLQLALPVIAVIFDDVLDAVRLLDRLAEVADEAAVDDRVADLRALDHRRDLARAQQRHGRDHHAAGLEHAEPRREHRVAVGPAQQHAVAGDQPVLLDQQPRDAPAEIVELGVGPAAMIVDHRQRVRRAALQQLRRRVQPLGILQLGQVEAEFRQQLRRRQAVTDEGVVRHRQHPRSDQRSWSHEGSKDRRHERWPLPSRLRGSCEASCAIVTPPPPPSSRSRPWPRFRPGP